ncbi:Hypothetical protein R9X50_00112200 [Acrodontium crateriforme]|uniref:Peptidase S33 tripeptidyl aminopeptidase-like C-terminal domain-containing protein n=1 Tax=Acrodontium crateriforme TaxID=150365 RepID=A0AAQ3R5J1_9PEZI|nr:Hypothetical protein R9X50_00112200 [Acrodontium crateriforme]
MEKQEYSPVPNPEASGKNISRKNSKRSSLTTLLLLAVAILTYRGISASRHSTIIPDIKKTSFDWDTAPTHSQLKYSDCYDGEYKCARLELPMDYWNGTTNATISLAVIRKPAVVPVTHPQYGGAILLNPGGPGGSGVDFIQRGSKEVRDAVDSKDGKYFDLISFDPRAVGETRPKIECFKSCGMDQSWWLRASEEGTFDSSDAAIGRVWAMDIAQGQSCSLARTDGQPDFKKYVTTAYVARDMLEIVERHGEWREAEAERILQHSRCKSKADSSSNLRERVNALRYKPGQENIQYWGFSYGTYLGSTFASMFPKRINRLLLDGVVNAYNYKQSLWSDNLLDTEKDLNSFYFHCARAGYPACALANKTGETTPEGVERRMVSIVSGLYHNPLPVIDETPEIITFSDVRAMIFTSLYSPIKKFPEVAQRLADIEAGNGTEFAKELRDKHDFTCLIKKPVDFKTRGLGSTTQIACTDGDDQSHTTKAEFENFIKELATTSPSVGAIWSQARMHCIHYTIRPVHRFEGPFEGKTSHPVLMIGNTADPVTPVIHAINMAKGYEGAVALTQDSAGHCSTSSFSKCTTTYIRDYFQTGRLPPPNTICKVDEFPFGPSQDETEIMDLEILEAKQSHAVLHDALIQAGGAFMTNGML